MGFLKTSYSYAALVALPLTLIWNPVYNRPQSDDGQDIVIDGVPDHFTRSFEEFHTIGRIIDENYITRVDWPDIVMDLAEYHNAHFEVPDNFLEDVSNNLGSLPQGAQYDPE